MQRQNNTCTSVHLISMEPPQKKKKTSNTFVSFSHLDVSLGLQFPTCASRKPINNVTELFKATWWMSVGDGCQLEQAVESSFSHEATHRSGSDTKNGSIYHRYLYHEPQNHEKKGFGQLETRLFTIKTTKNVAFGGPWYKYTSRIRTCLCFVFGGWTLQEGPNSDQNKGLHLRIGLAVSPGDGFFCGWQVMVSWIPRKYCI